MKFNLPSLSRPLSIIALIFIGGSLLNHNLIASASVQQNNNISQQVDQTQEVVIRLYYDNQDQLNSVAGSLDIWEVHPLPVNGPTAGYVVIAVDPVKQNWLISQGYRVELDLEKTRLLQAPEAVLDPRYYYFDNFVNNPNHLYMVDFLQAINATHPGITELLDEGDAWLASHAGHARDIWVLRISNEDPQYGDIADKPTFFMMANIHAREVTTPEMAIRYIKYLTEGYNGEGGYDNDPDVTWLVNHHATYIMLTINPDGRVKNEQNSGLWWRKNVDNDDGCGSSYGVDLNRNSDFYWGWDDWGSSPYPCDETYRGPSPGSEPETAAFQDFAATVFQDWNGNNGDFDIVASPDNTSGIFLTLHSYADDILWPFGFNPGSAPNNDQLETIARKLADITGVMLPTGGIGYSVNGSSDDWIYGKLGIPAFTYEIGPNTGICGSFFPDYRCQDGLPGVTRNFWGELKESFVYINKIAATPYITAYGPDAQNLTAIPQVNPTLFDLAATVLDQRYSGDPLQHIMAAEYFIDAPGSDGLGFAMSPSDGSWGGTSEAVEAVVDASILDQGRHYLLVHGKNDDNVWGPYTAVFIEVSAPTYEVSLTPDNAHGQDDPGQMVTYQLQVNNIGHNSDTYNIDVDSLWSSTAPPNIGPLNPGESAVFDLQVTIPLSATHGETDFATITSSSQHNPDVSDSSLLITTANLYDLSLTPATGEGNGYPGGQAEYILQVTNTGNTTDTFDISASGVWSVTAPPVIDPLEAGGSADINVTVSVPPTAEAGDFDLSTITATSQGNSSMTHSSALTTHAVQVGPIVTPATVGGSGDPGSSVSYQLQLTNHNSLPDTFILTSNSSWSIHYPGTAGPIPAEGSTFIDVTVDIPADADGGVIDTAVITFTSSMPDLPIATATLSTRANDVFSFTVSPVEDSVTAYGTGITVQYTLQVTNNGNSADSYTFHVISSEWLVDVPVTIGPLAPGETTSVPVSVQVPLGISMGDSNNATITVISQHNFVGHQVYLHTDTFWYSFLIPLIQKH